MNERPQFSSTKSPATKDPTMFPTEVCMFQVHMMSPRLDLPNQLPMRDTTDGHPVAWKVPARTCSTGMVSALVKLLGHVYKYICTAFFCPDVGKNSIKRIIFALCMRRKHQKDECVKAHVPQA